MEPDLSEKTPKGKNLVPVIVSSVLISALLAGWGVYAYQKSQNDKSQDDLRSQIDTLKAQVSVAKTVVANPTSMATPTPQTTASLPPIATPNPTANWKTYTNTASGVTYQYPQGWTAMPNHPDEAENIYTPWHPYLAGSQNNPSAVRVYFQNNTYSSSIDNYLSSLHIALISKEQFDMNGKVAYRVNASSRTFVVVFTTNWVIEIDNNATLLNPITQSQREEVNQAYGTILTTFTF